MYFLQNGQLFVDEKEAMVLKSPLRPLYILYSVFCQFLCKHYQCVSKETICAPIPILK